MRLKLLFFCRRRRYRILENNNIHQISSMTFSGLNSLVLLWVFILFHLVVILCDVLWADQTVWCWEAVCWSDEWVALALMESALPLVISRLSDWKGFAEQLSDEAGWHLSGNAEIELAVSTVGCQEIKSCLVKAATRLLMDWFCLCVFVSWRVSCRDLEGNLIETIGNLSLNSCSMLTVL